MIKKAYHYLYFRTYQVVFKSNKTSTESASVSILSLSFLINVISIYFLFNRSFNTVAFYIFCTIGLGLAIMNLVYFNDIRHKEIIFEFKDLKISMLSKYLIDYYPYLSFLILLICLKASYTTIFYYLGILAVIKLAELFWET